MNKQGSHADWAISMGIFLIYLLALFIIIRPGVEPIHDENILLDIVESGFNNDVKWVVKMSPLIVDACKIAAIITVEDKSKNWKFETAVADKPPAGDVTYCIKSNSRFELDCGYPLCPPATSRNFHLYYTPDKHNTANPELDLTCAGPVEDCKADLGSSEDIKGINSKWLDELEADGKNEEGYIKIKDRWAFPASKEFSIFVDNKKIIGKEPYENANIYVREWKDWYVYKDGTKKEARLSIRIW